MVDKTTPDLAERAFRRRRRRDAALVLPLLGVVLFMSPVRGLFAQDLTILGIPLPFLFVFGSWLALIALAWRMSRLLTRRDEDN